MIAEHERLIRLADAAFMKAAKKVLAQAEQYGTFVILWENGGIVRRRVKNGKLVKPRKRRAGA